MSAVLEYYDKEKQKYIPLPIGSESAGIANYEYSTQEICIGCWTDGRPIYRRVYTIVLGTTTTDGTEVSSYSSVINNVDKVINLHATFKASSGSQNMIPFENPSGYKVRILFDNAGRIVLGNSIKSFSGATAYATIEYTKTTDAVNSFTIDKLTFGKIDTVATDAEVKEVLG